MTLAQDITRAFNGDWHGSYGTIPTPGHSPKDRGTTVRDNDNGDDVVLSSFNGGDWKAIKDECRRRGLLGDRDQPANDRGAWRETGVYEYVGADGAVAYRTVRKEKAGERKRFVAQRPDGRGGWVNGLDRDGERILYRLPDILAADPATIVYLTEGERKADKLASWGLVATAVAFGARGWRASYAMAMAGRTVAILPDNDDEGRGFAVTAAASITAAGGKAVIVTLPDLPPKGDVIDWSGDADALRLLTAAALNPPVETLPLLDPAAWAREETPSRTWALYEMILVGQVTYLTGAGASGKSLLGQQLATCIATGTPFLGLEVLEGVALYVTCEDDKDELHRRQKAICSAIGVPIHTLSGRLHPVTLAGAIGNELATFDPLGRMATTPAWQRLRDTVLMTRATFIVLDNVAHLFAGNENIRNQVAAFLSLLNGLATETGAAILLIGHPNKAGDSYSGSTAWENQVRSRLFLERPSDPAGGVLDPDARTLLRGKANYARNGDALTFRWHQWAFVRDEDLPADVIAEIGEIVAASGDNEVFLSCLDARTRDGLVVSPNVSPKYAPSQFEAMPAAKGIGRNRLRQAMERLLAIGAVEVFDHEKKGKGVTVKALRRSQSQPPRTPSRTAPEPVPERLPNLPEQSSRTLPHTHLPPKGGKGAATWAAAPSTGKEGKPDLTRVIFPAPDDPPAAPAHGFSELDPDDIEWPDEGMENDQ